MSTNTKEYESLKQKIKALVEEYKLLRPRLQSKLQSYSASEHDAVMKAELEILAHQVQEHKSAIEALLSQNNPDYVRIESLTKLFKKALHELKKAIKPEWQQWIEFIVFYGLIAFILRYFVFGLYHVPSGSAEPNLLVGDRIFGNKLAYRYSSVKHGDLVIFDEPEFEYDQTSVIQRIWQKTIGIPLLGLLKAGPINVVKRVVGCPGDIIEGKIEEGKTVVYRNGVRLDEKYVNPLPLIALKRSYGFFDSQSLLGKLMPSFLHTGAHFAKYTYDPSYSFDDQPYYWMKEEEVVFDPLTNKPCLYHAYSPTRTMHGRSIDVFGPFIVPQDKYWVMGDSRKNSHDSRAWGFLDKSLIQGKAAFIIFSIDSEESFWLFSVLKNPLAFWKKGVRWNRTFTSLNVIPDLTSLAKKE